jgi:hypothetical protein
MRKTVGLALAFLVAVTVALLGFRVGAEQRNDGGRDRRGARHHATAAADHADDAPDGAESPAGPDPEDDDALIDPGEGPDPLNDAGVTEESDASVSERRRGGGGGGGGPAAGSVPYDVVYVRAPRYGDEQNSTWPEVKDPFSADPGADLVLLHPDGREEVLVKGGGDAVTDPFVSFDAKWIYFAKLQGVSNARRGREMPSGGADIYRINLATRKVDRLTNGEKTPNRPGDNVPSRSLNLGPCPVPGGRIAFTSNRNGLVPTKPFSTPTMQIFVMDADGSNVEPIAPMTLGSALHPTILRDGRLMFSSYESQGLRDGRLWGLWSILPDGRYWQPLVSAFHHPQAFHFQTQLSDEDIVVIEYYNQNNNGFGAAYRFPGVRPTPAFHSAFDRPPIRQTMGRRGPGGLRSALSFPFVPIGFEAITPFTHPHDSSASCPSPKPCAPKDRVGKVTHPSGAPGGDLLIVWSPGPAANQGRPVSHPVYDGGIYLMPGGGPIETPRDLILLKNDPRYNEAWPRAVVPYREIHGVDEPARTPWLPNDGTTHPALPEGTPFGLVGSSSLYKRESKPGGKAPGYDGLETFFGEGSSNWRAQGADAGKYSNDDIWAIRIVALEPNVEAADFGDNGRLFSNYANERHRILGEIPVRKSTAQGRPILDPEGNPDTSFLVKIPADTPFTFQTLDRNGMLLNMAQTWHQVRPGEMRADCGGCHAHSQRPLAFDETAAARADYQIYDLSKVTPLIAPRAHGDPDLDLREGGVVDVEFLRDIRPILDRSCVSCHRGERAPADLRLDDRTLYDGLPGDFRRLADDEKGQWGRKSVLRSGAWGESNASRYVRKFQSRRSLLTWKLFGARLDGWTNEDHPTERVAGDAMTLPAEAKPDLADLDYDGQRCPPPGSPQLSIEEKMLFVRWIDLGAPIDAGRRGRGKRGWFSDEIRPTLMLTYPKPGANVAPLAQILIGAADANSGLDEDSLSITADFPLGGRPAGRELRGAFEAVGDGIWALRLGSPITDLDRRKITAVVRDRQGNETRIERTFSVR